MATRPRIKFMRTVPSTPPEYGKKFDTELNQAIGGEDRWETEDWAHGVATTKNKKLRIQRFEDGPEFILQTVSTLAACGSFLVSAAALWFSLPKKEKAQNGERFIQIETDELRLEIKAKKPKKAKKQLRRLLKSL